MTHGHSLPSFQILFIKNHGFPFVKTNTLRSVIQIRKSGDNLSDTQQIPILYKFKLKLTSRFLFILIIISPQSHKTNSGPVQVESKSSWPQTVQKWEPLILAAHADAKVTEILQDYCLDVLYFRCSQ